tara:strand:+ start:1615 stop:2337 length:723 start_codon:yes stop_codon:yes gene_type:complete
MSLKEEIRKIVQVQNIDSRIHKLKLEKETLIPEQLQKLKEEFESKKENLASFEEDFKKIQLKKKESEVELASKEDVLRKAQADLYKLKTNKEYQAKLTEIGSLKADISVAEEDVLIAMDDIENCKKTLEAQKADLAAEEKLYKDKQSETANTLKDFEAQISSLNNERNNYAKEVEPKTLAKYDDLLVKRHGLAAVPVVGNNCGACHILLNHQQINEIKMYADLVICGNCVRILYIPEDLE